MNALQNRLHSMAEVAKVLRISRNDAYDLVRHGHLKALKLGSLKVSTFELEDFMRRSAGLDYSNLDQVVKLHEEAKP